MDLTSGEICCHHQAWVRPCIILHPHIPEGSRSVPVGFYLLLTTDLLSKLSKPKPISRKKDREWITICLCNRWDSRHKNMMWRTVQGGMSFLVFLSKGLLRFKYNLGRTLVTEWMQTHHVQPQGCDWVDADTPYRILDMWFCFFAEILAVGAVARIWPMLCGSSQRKALCLWKVTMIPLIH